MTEGLGDMKMLIHLNYEKLMRILFGCHFVASGCDVFIEPQKYSVNSETGKQKVKDHPFLALGQDAYSIEIFELTK